VSSRYAEQRGLNAACAFETSAPLPPQFGRKLAGLRVQKFEHKAVDQFDSMTDEELRQYVYGNKDIS
jgi:hypothetical protein